MLALLRRARRRLFYNDLFAQGANASSAALLAFIFLLLLGTEILAWHFVVLIPALALVAGVSIAIRRRATPYAAAQRIDRRLRLADTLSTACFFNDSEQAAKAAPEIVRSQAEAAEHVAATVDIRRAVPFQMPRTAYAMAALFLLAGSLFALRYGISRRLDLKQPLAAMLHDTFAKDPVQQARAKQPKSPKPDYAPDADLASDRDPRNGDPLDSAADQSEEINEGQPGKLEGKSLEGSKKSQDAGDQSSAEQEATAEDRSGNESDGESAPGQNGKQDSKPGNNSKQDANSSGENNSLMSKVKDAVQNLLSRMKPQQNQSGGQQQSGEQNGQQAKGQQSGSKQQNAKNGQQQGAQQQGEGQEGQSGEQAQNTQDQQGKGTGNSDSKQASKQPGSGVGSQDGDKALKQAQQLAAMGKLSEIIGKRSQTISGETTVEVQNTQQQLRTQYSRQAVQHSQANSDIGRDEIPVALQSYVEQYFEAVRKSAPKK